MAATPMNPIHVTTMRRDNHFYAKISRPLRQLDDMAQQEQILLAELTEIYDTAAGVDGVNDTNGIMMREALRALRRVCSAWRLYPAVGDSFEDAKCLDSFDFAKTAMTANKPCEKTSVSWLISSKVARAVNQIGNDEPIDEANTRLAGLDATIRYQYCAWWERYQQMPIREDMISEDEDIAADREEDPETFTYTGSTNDLPSIIASRHQPRTRSLGDDNTNEHDANGDSDKTPSKKPKGANTPRTTVRNKPLAEHWLHDEDDWAVAEIQANLQEIMPDFYKRFNIHFGGTMYQDETMAAPRARRLFKPHTGTDNNAGMRNRDEGWRSFEAVRQRFQDFKKDCKKDLATAKWTKVRTMNVFLLPAGNFASASATMAGAASASHNAIVESDEDGEMNEYEGVSYTTSHGWTPVNGAIVPGGYQTLSSLPKKRSPKRKTHKLTHIHAQTDEPARKKQRYTDEVEGEAGEETLEDFVAQQSGEEIE